MNPPRLPAIKPPALRVGDTIGILAPASNVWRDLLTLGCRKLEDMGYRWKYLDSIFEQELFFAGSLERRVRELEEMFADDSVRGLICARGGYGCNYLLPSVNLDVLRAHPKIFIGYSDVTMLLTHFADATGLVTFHGPMITKDFAAPGGLHLESWVGAVSGERWLDVTLPTTPRLTALREGVAEGILYGGCLSMLVASLGTPYQVQTADTILLLEDVNVKPYQLDRLLVQMKQAGKFDGVRGIVFGEMLHCGPGPSDQYKLEDILLRTVGDLGVPVAFGLPFGHVAGENLTLPLGIRVRFTAAADAIRLQALEASVETRS